MYDSLEEIVSVCEKEKISFPDLIIREDAADADITIEEEIGKMQVMWQEVGLWAEMDIRCRSIGRVTPQSVETIWEGLFRRR